MTLSSLLKIFVDLMLLAIPVIASLSLLSFFWGLVKFIAKAGAGDVKEGKQLMIWGTIALFVMVSIWGVLRFANDELELGEFGFPQLPES